MSESYPGIRKGAAEAHGRLVMKVAALQCDITWEDPAANFERLAGRLEAAVDDGARLLVLPEMFACGFSMRSGALQEADDGPTPTFLREQARRLGAWVCGSHPEARADGARHPHNTMLIAGPSGEVERYRKIHPFSMAGEHEHYSAGEQSVTIDLEGLRVTPFICYDLRFADVFWERAVEADAYVVIANWPEARREHWRTLLRARAIENQAFVVGVNRVGEGGGLTYTGDSAIVDPAGEVLAEAGRSEATLLGDLDPGRVATVRRELPFLVDRRPRDR